MLGLGMGESKETKQKERPGSVPSLNHLSLGF